MNVAHEQMPRQEIPSRAGSPFSTEGLVIMKTAQIVLIEDNSADVLLVEMALKQSGILYEMTRFKNGQAALASLCPPEGTAKNAFLPDAILLDLNTPKSDGFEVLGKLRQNPFLADVPMAILTSSQAESDKRRTSLMGAIRYIEKPTQLEEFLTTVGRAIKEMLHA
jgi:chemotaxis family two-component system response regulator Rcp1